MTLKFPEITVNARITIDGDILMGLVTHIFEHDDYGSFRIASYEGDVPKDAEWPRYVVAAVTTGCAVLIKDKYGDEPDTTYCIDSNSLEVGLQIMAEKYPKHFTDVLEDNCDVYTSDVLAQCIAYGRLVY